jgi:hypothetical protein
MKTIAKVAGGLLGALAVVVLILVGLARVFGFDPGPWRPGLWIRGEVVTEPVTDWTFAKDLPGPTVLQTRDWLIPGLAYSVTTARFIHNGKMYIGSGYATGIQMPEGRHWNQNILADPVVRIRIDGKLYDRRLVYVTDPEEYDAICREYGTRTKILWAPGYYIHFWRVEPLA